MHVWSDTDLLAAWERGQSHTPAQRALTLLALACPETSLQTLEQWTLGRRDAELLTLRGRLFGPELRCRTDCPTCGERLELTMPVDSLRATGSTVAQELDLHHDGYEVRFRLPIALDVAQLRPDVDAPANRRWLVERCVLAAQHEGEVAAADLPEAVVSALGAQMAEADPQADIQLALKCPVCQLQWQEVFDIASFLWAEIQILARRLLHEVHELAAAYGWREAEILALSPSRRQAYLELIRS